MRIAGLHKRLAPSYGQKRNNSSGNKVPKTYIKATFLRFLLLNCFILHRKYKYFQNNCF